MRGIVAAKGARYVQIVTSSKDVPHPDPAACVGLYILLADEHVMLVFECPTRCPAFELLDFFVPSLEV
jgi:hypothetical protein